MDAAYFQFDGVDLYFPAVLRESSEFTSTVTEHAVERGANIVDHVRSNSPKISLEVHISNSPIEIGGLADMQLTFVELDVKGAAAAAGNSGPGRTIPLAPGALIQAASSAVQSLINGEPIYKALVLKATNKINLPKEVIRLLEGWRTESVLGTVILPWATIESCVITGVNPTRSAEDGDAIRATIELQQINLVESRLVAAPEPAEVRAKPKVAKGKQPTTPTNQAKSSILYSGLKNKLPGLLGGGGG